MKNIYLTILIAFFCLNAFSQSKKELKSIIERKTIDSVRIHKEFSLHDSTLNEKIFELNNQIESLTAEKINLQYLLNEKTHKLNSLSPPPEEIEVFEDEDERELEHYEHYDTEKPIIYLYPEKTQEIEVQLDYDGKLTHTYPKYTGGWKVTANPDGTLFDAKNQEYYALYWEGKPNKDYTIDEGFLVPKLEGHLLMPDPRISFPTPTPLAKANYAAVEIPPVATPPTIDTPTNPALPTNFKHPFSV